jgi:hypothetical protein
MEKEQQIKELSRLLFNRTETWAKDQGLLTDSCNSTYSEKAKKYDKIIKGNFGCYEDKVRELVEELIDEKLPRETEAFFYISGIVLVPLSDMCNHKYTIGEPVLRIGVNDTKFKLLDGSTKTSAFPTTKNKFMESTRIATLEEIEFFVEKFMESKTFAAEFLIFALANFE